MTLPPIDPVQLFTIIGMMYFVHSQPREWSLAIAIVWFVMAIAAAVWNS